MFMVAALSPNGAARGRLGDDNMHVKFYCAELDFIAAEVCSCGQFESESLSVTARAFEDPEVTPEQYYQLCKSRAEYIELIRG